MTVMILGYRYPISLTDKLLLQMHLGEALLQEPAMQRMHVPREGYKAMGRVPERHPKAVRKEASVSCE